MGFDARLKRFFPLVIGAVIAGTAYLQAAGIGELVGASVADVPAPTATVVPRSARTAGAPSTLERPSAKDILARNPFDSETGPLDGTVITMPDAGIPLPEADKSGDPYEDPTCDVGRVVLISAADDPAWSFAAIQTGPEAPKLRRTGDDVGGQTVHFVSWDRVWLMSGASRCQLKLGEPAKGGGASAANAGADAGARPARSGRTLPPDLAAKIHKVSDTEFNVERSVVDEILENQALLMRTARIVPDKEGDKVVGVKLFGVRKGTLLDHLGLQNSDRLVSINDFDISDPQKALEAYGRLRTADHLKVSINRNGQPMNIDFNIQ
jgi:general secretion pathway protein C